MSYYKNRRNNTSTFNCDECGEVFDTEGVDFRDALEDFKANGGTARLEHGEWLHLCADCK